MKYTFFEKLKGYNIVCLSWNVVSYLFPTLNGHDLKILRSFVRKGDAVFDVGANIGSFTFTLSKLVGKHGKVIACEPIWYNFEKLSYTKKLLKLDNVIVEPVALSNSIGSCRMQIPLLNGSPKRTRSYIDLNDGKGYEVPQTTMQALYKKHNLKKIDFIKCDVEGAEKLVLEGAAELIREFKPVVLCEIQDHHSKRFGSTANETMQYIKELGGYQVLGVVGKKTVNVEAPSDECINYFFVPSNQQ